MTEGGDGARIRRRLPDFAGLRTKQCDTVVFYKALSLPARGKPPCQKLTCPRLASKL
jgi:hypothetical protein